MKFAELLRLVGDDPLFDSSVLQVGKVRPGYIQRQLSGWTSSGKLLQLRRGLYAIAKPYRKVEPHPFVIANRLVRGSYVSLETALSFHGLIPEFGAGTVVSATLARPARLVTPLGSFQYHHLHAALFAGCQRTKVAAGQTALVASPTKALVDLLYLRAGSDDREYLRQLRLQNTDRLDLGELERLWTDSQPGKRRRIVRMLRELADEEAFEPVP
jgi:predicted transcriptional regulator of viral defense system